MAARLLTRRLPRRLPPAFRGAGRGPRALGAFQAAGAALGDRRGGGGGRLRGGVFDAGRVFLAPVSVFLWTGVLFGMVWVFWGSGGCFGCLFLSSRCFWCLVGVLGAWGCVRSVGVFGACGRGRCFWRLVGECFWAPCGRLRTHEPLWFDSCRDRGAGILSQNLCAKNCARVSYFRLTLVP